jgi:hypothetical protein
MSEEPKAPNVPEPNGDIPPENFQPDRRSGEDASISPLAEDLRRVTGDLDSLPGPATSTGRIPPAAGEIHGTGSLMRRLTGPIRRTTGPLSGGEPLPTPPEDLPAQDVDDAFDMRLSSLSGSPKPGTPPPARNEPPSPPAPVVPAQRGPRETNSLMQRITGTLKRVTGPLGDTAPLRSSRLGIRGPDEKTLPAGIATPADSQPAAADEPGEKRKRVSGPLGSVLSGILRGQPGEDTKSPRRKSDSEDYVSEIRQNLASEEIVRPKRSRNSGLFQRLTGNLRRMTGSLGHTGDIRRPETKPPAQPDLASDFTPVQEVPQSEMDAEIEEVLLEDRLAGTKVTEPFTWAEPEDFIIELGPPEAESAGKEEEGTLAAEMTQPAELSGDEPISLLDSGAIAALSKAEMESRQSDTEPDWMAEIRHAAAEEEAEKGSADSADKQKGATSPLRDFIAGIFRNEEKQPPVPEIEFSDDLVTGRLGLDLDTKPAEGGSVPGEPALPDWDAVNMPLSGEYAAPKEEDFSLTDDSSFLDRFQTNFSQDTAGETAATDEARPGTADLGEEVGHFVPYEPLQSHDTGEVFTISPDDENLLWGATPGEGVEEGKTFSADDYWDPLQASVTEEKTEPKKPQSADDAYAAAFLTGADLPPNTGRLGGRKRSGTGKLNRETEKKPFEDIRSVLLDDYQAAEQRQGRAAAPAVAEKAGESAVPQTHDAAFTTGFPGTEEKYLSHKPRDTREWLATRTILQKIILIEMILVVLALFTAVPFFFYLLMRNSQAATAVPNKLPANLPYPAGVILPGGWHFQLERSTMDGNQWKPKQSEWLEGTELRRVVALPWNRQTEAVVRSFQAGDMIDLELSNADTIAYTVERIEQVSVADNSIYSGNTSSLVIILYPQDGKEQTRWVVFCKR